MTQLQQVLIDRYGKEGAVSKQDSMTLLSVGMGAKEFGFEREILDYLEQHPSATLKELDAFAAPFFPEIVEED
ncbi:hypothetical protein [Pseudoflavonifractor phocaeensis]|uniref:hypothetical protein n=1 Tax=Pseudoflavonifractor phocaeensis TaxID=1870988 RepID=UPI001957913A|nr:hypothetical protein [Pseudoflavonifractor phocaeensis]MBM6871221.1 hypothetical protein [Pseudoflavonifractor phocaeensis]